MIFSYIPLHYIIIVCIIVVDMNILVSINYKTWLVQEDRLKRSQCFSKTAFIRGPFEPFANDESTRKSKSKPCIEGQVMHVLRRQGI